MQLSPAGISDTIREELHAIAGPREPVTEVGMPRLKKSKVEPRSERPC
jgi:hypothetical protein